MANFLQKEWFFPEIKDKDKAKQVARQGVWAALFLAVVTSIIATIAILQKRVLPEPLSQIDAWSFLDVGIFVAIAWGIYKMSRVAAVAGLLLYIAGQVYLRMSNPKMTSSGIFVAVFIVLAFINAIRGTFAYHSLPPTNNADVDPEV